MLDRAADFAVATQGADGAWRVPTQPRILDNAVAAYSLAGVEAAEKARERAERWLATATVQRHDPLVEAADRWLLDLNTRPSVPAFPGLAAQEGPHQRRALYLHAIACAADAPGADPHLLLDHARTALGDDRGARIKPWQRTLLLAFEAIAHHALGRNVSPETPDELASGQSADGSYYGMPMVTAILHLALTRIAPDHPATARSRRSLLADQHSDGTWRFMVSEIWDTGLMVRALRGHPGFDRAALLPAFEFLVSAQREDGGWACAQALDSDNDTTGSTLLAQTPEGTWDDRPIMYGPRPFLTVTTTHVHALAARGLRDVLLPAQDRTGAGR
ncbi:hypothetical protein KPATCC21470_0810 [Kitasatospora purpeofusca]